jgi:sterol desaturase/sphingolipid hydroxylase (fatty acid hydroxylase superfamily)
MTSSVPEVAQRHEAFRARVLARWGRWYWPWAHLLAPGLVGLGLIAAAVTLLDRPGPIVLALAGAWAVALNGLEWFVHRDLLHHSRWAFYDRHTPEHHGLFQTDSMVIRSTREFAVVLIPGYALLTIFVGLAPIALGLGLIDRNLGLLFYAVSIAYVLAYEWLHLVYHLRPPAGGWPGWLEALRRHHAAHHDPALMSDWNFNTTVPLWDWLAGTLHRPTVAGASTPVATPGGKS